MSRMFLSKPVLGVLAALAPVALCLVCCTPEEPAPGTPPKQAAGQKKPANGTQKRGSVNSRSAGAQEAAGDLLTYPRDEDRVMATVNGRNITLGEIISHIDDRHSPGFANYVSTKVGQLEIRSPLMASWTRQYADTVALRTEARKRSTLESRILAETGKVLAQATEDFKKDYEARLNRKFPTVPESVQALRDDFLKKRGLSLELEGILNALVPEEFNQFAADEYLKANVEAVNGILNIAHILVSNRDSKTGALFSGDAMKAVRKKVAEIKRRLENGEEFEVVAKETSDDRRTAEKGGRLDNILRFDARLPASLCRAAWGTRNNKWSGPIETPFGMHFVKRVKWINRRMVVKLDIQTADVRKLIRTHRKEDTLFAARKDHHVVLHY